jgi:hypothetical protein
MSQKSLFNFFAQIRSSIIIGFSDDTYSSLGINKYQPFFMGQYSFGVILNKSICISIKGLAFAPKEIRDNVDLRFSLTAIPFK